MLRLWCPILRTRDSVDMIIHDNIKNQWPFRFRRSPWRSKMVRCRNFSVVGCNVA